MLRRQLQLHFHTNMTKQYNKRTIIYGAIIALWLCFIWGHSLQPAVASTAESNFWIDFLKNHLGVTIGEFLIRKAAHFTEYIILGFLLTLEMSTFVKKVWTSCIYPMFAGILTAMVDETIQLFSLGRSSEVRDVWIDFAGVFFATIITCAIINHKRQDTTTND